MKIALTTFLAAFGSALLSGYDTSCNFLELIFGVACVAAAVSLLVVDVLLEVGYL